MTGILFDLKEKFLNGAAVGIRQTESIGKQINEEKLSEREKLLFFVIDHGPPH
jgi:hypothetical protein